MEATERCYGIADRIISILADSKCTVEEAEGILRYVNGTIRNTSTVHHATKATTGS